MYCGKDTRHRRSSSLTIAVVGRALHAATFVHVVGGVIASKHDIIIRHQLCT